MASTEKLKLTLQKPLLVFSCVWRALVGLDVPHTTALDKYVVCTYSTWRKGAT